MLVELKSNGTRHDITAETWALMKRDQKRNYRVINSTETQVAENKAENKTKAMPATGEVVSFMKEDELKALLKKKKITLTEEEFAIVNDNSEEGREARLKLEADLIAR